MKPGQHRRRIIYSSEEKVEVPVERSKKNIKWKGKTPSNYKYFDDNLQINMINMETAVRWHDGDGQYQDKHGVQCQNTFRYIVRRAMSGG